MAAHRVCLGVLAGWALGACADRDGRGGRAGREDEAGRARVAVSPPVVGRGTTVEIHLEASRSSFVFGDTEARTGGAGLGLGEVTVHDGWSATVPVTTPEDAPLGPVSLKVASGGQSWVIEDALTVVAESLAIEPGHAKLGELVEIRVTGTATDFDPGRTWASVGDGVRIVSVEVLSPTEALVEAAIAPDAVPGLRPFAMENGPERVILYDGFTIDRAGVAAVFDPPQVYQGSTVEFTVRGRDTTWTRGERVPDGDGGWTLSGGSEVAFWDGGGQNADITVRELRVVDTETITGVIQVSNAAALGSRDLFVTGLEDTLVPDALQVLDTPADLGMVATGLQFDVERVIDAETGEIHEEVQAFGYFVIPLNPPCSQPGRGGEGPGPFDEAGLYPIPPPPPPADCPNPETVGAGDMIWLESEENIVPMYRDVIQSTGQIIYLSRDLTLADYHFDTWYDLRIEGEPFGVPPATIERVLPTVPADLVLTDPQWCCRTTHDRARDLVYTWNPARTYPVALLYTELETVLEADGGPAFVGAYPWDDGEHAYPAAHLARLAPGPAAFTARISIEGPPFGLPDSVIQSTQASSEVTVQGTVVLQ